MASATVVGMFNTSFPARAAAPVMETIRNVKPGQLDAPTPCAEWDVRRLVNHLLFYAPTLEAAAAKESVPPPAASESDVDLTAGDWAAALEAAAGRVSSAWSAPEAWVGTTTLGAPPELPADLIGGMVVGEFVVHGWDLARATGQAPAWDDELLEYLRAEVERSAQQGRELGVYGPEVPLPADSSTLDRVLALTGRNPGWTP